ncbi:Ca-activated chloride channel family protein [Sphingopyxis panaciterrae]|uniref:vWA domain-containing protein n=1 Tax=Sphingopyxis panaciterrae TaxID=363841 RepID=UPI0014216843|nr:VWA domain-containing protein [Sphingopyxis panaciterrae]NIJ36678.1 Ca-activated chloride channel family protein [Sphingopyxis panaciterrae]
MASIKFFHTSLIALAMLATAAPISVMAQDAVQQDDEDANLDSIIVSGARIRQGGAQDIQHFRSMALTAISLPRPESLSVEGLLGEHDLTLPARGACAELFCLNVQAMPASLPTRPDDLLFLGMAFDSNIDAESWKREPLSIMAVVDRSGSMDGSPIANVKAALHQMVDELGPKDRLGIVIYGTNSNVHLSPTAAQGNKQVLHAAIDTIAIDGSTSMEAGLTLGYATAIAEAGQFGGKVRMMLFTDEQPNTGRTDAGSFMAMAEDASRRGIGLTTIGVGVQYDGALATKISSVRGGNLFFVAGPEKGGELMRKEFRNMVSEVAHDLIMTLTPHAGYRISGVFGVPDGLMTEGKDGAIAVTVPTAFLSSNGGGIYASLGKAEGRAHLPTATLADGSPLMDVSLTYVSALDGSKHGDALSIGAPTAEPAANLRLAQTLVDQYLVLDAATRAFHRDGNAKQAFALLDGLQTRLAGVDYADLKDERELVDTMRSKAAIYAGYGGEVPKDMQPMRVLGKWRVVALNGVEDLSRNDVVEFTDNDEFITYFQRPLRGDDEMYQGFQINEREIYIPEGDLRMRYWIDGDRLRMKSSDGNVRIVLERETKS